MFCSESMSAYTLENTLAECVESLTFLLYWHESEDFCPPIFIVPYLHFIENKQNWADKANTVLTEGRDRGLLMEDLWTQILVNSCIKKLTSGLCSYEQQHLST